jgi:hypothetical protein
MRKFSIAISAAIAALTLTACGGATTAPTTLPSTTVETTTTLPELSQADKELLFVNYVAGEYPAFVAMMGRKDLVDLAQSVCDEIEFNGLTTASLTEMVVNAGLANYAGEIGFTLGAGIPIFCPQNQWFIDTIGS